MSVYIYTRVYERTESMCWKKKKSKDVARFYTPEYIYICVCIYSYSYICRCSPSSFAPPPSHHHHHQLSFLYLDIKPYRLGDVIRDKTLLLLPILYYSLHSKFNRYSSFFFSLLFSSELFFAFFFEVALGRFPIMFTSLFIIVIPFSTSSFLRYSPWVRDYPARINSKSLSLCSSLFLYPTDSVWVWLLLPLAWMAGFCLS